MKTYNLLSVLTTFFVLSPVLSITKINLSPDLTYTGATIQDASNMVEIPGAEKPAVLSIYDINTSSYKMYPLEKGLQILLDSNETLANAAKTNCKSLNSVVTQRVLYKCQNCCFYFQRTGS